MGGVLGVDACSQFGPAEAGSGAGVAEAEEFRRADGVVEDADGDDDQAEGDMDPHGDAPADQPVHDGRERRISHDIPVEIDIEIKRDDGPGERRGEVGRGGKADDASLVVRPAFQERDAQQAEEQYWRHQQRHGAEIIDHLADVRMGPVEQRPVGEVEAEAGEPLGEVPVEHRRLHRDSEKRGEPELRHQIEAAQLRPPEHPDGESEAEENAVILGQHRETEQRGGEIEPAPAADAVFPIGSEDIEGVARGEDEKHQQMIVEGEARHCEDDGDRQVDDGAVPEPAGTILRRQPFRPQPENRERAGEAQPGQQADGKIAPAEERGDEAPAASRRRRMVEYDQLRCWPHIQ